MFSVFDQGDDGDEVELYSLKYILDNESNPDDFEYGTGRTTRLRMMAEIFIRYACGITPPPNRTLNRDYFRRRVAYFLQEILRLCRLEAEGYVVVFVLALFGYCGATRLYDFACPSKLRVRITRLVA